MCYNVLVDNRDVAQFGRALRSGRRGRRFESCHLDHQRDAGPLSPAVSSVGDFYAREGLCYAVAIQRQCRQPYRPQFLLWAIFMPARDFLLDQISSRQCRQPYRPPFALYAREGLIRNDDCTQPALIKGRGLLIYSKKCTLDELRLAFFADECQNAQNNRNLRS